MYAEDVMTTKLHTVGPAQSLRETAIKFAELGISGCPVVDEKGEIIGMLSEEDILEELKTHYKELRMLMPPEITFGISFVEVLRERDAIKAFQELKDIKVEDAMKSPPITVKAGDKVENVIALMVKHKINRVPVVKDGKLVGMITRGDVLRGFFRQVDRGERLVL